MTEKDTFMETSDGRILKKPHNMVMSRLFLFISVLSLSVTVVLLLLGRGGHVGPFVVAFFAFLALYVRSHPLLSVVTFT